MDESGGSPCPLSYGRCLLGHEQALIVVAELYGPSSYLYAGQ